MSFEKEQEFSQKGTYDLYDSDGIPSTYKGLVAPISFFGAGNEIFQEKIKSLFEWASKKGAEYYSFLTYPRTEGISEKQETFLTPEYFLEESGMVTHENYKLSSSILKKGQTDGSSFPTGGLRHTSTARGYTIIDTKSEMFIRKNKVLYIPAMMVSHHGEALDDKTLFRRAENKLEQNSIQLLSLLGVKTNKVAIASGFEQEFFVINRQSYMKRYDLKSCGRALFGDLPSKNQQFSDHYYGKFPTKMETIISQVERQLKAMGVPVRTRHNEVAPNQYEFCPVFEDAGKCVDHNMIAMEVIKETLNKHGLVALFHEKPFRGLNGSGKHCNWSLNYADEKGKLVNLFQYKQQEKARDIFTLFVLLNLLAIQNNNQLYLNSISSPGNQYRLGGHEAPPRIVSVFLGSTLSALLDNQKLPEPKNLKEKVPNIEYDVFQQNTDRNRTSPYAFTGNKFEFRAVGSSQNVSFPLAVIAATLAHQVQKVIKRIKEGTPVKDIIEILKKQTKPVRFDGNGYEAQWLEEAKKRGLYVNQNFSDIFKNNEKLGQVFVDIGACTEKEIQAKFAVSKEQYINTVQTECNAHLRIINKQIVPAAMQYLRENESLKTVSDEIKESVEDIEFKLGNLLKGKQILENQLKTGSEDLSKNGELRKCLSHIATLIDKLLSIMPRNHNLPQMDEILGVL